MNRKVSRALDQISAEFVEKRHADAVVSIRSAGDFADFLGYNISRITKTLLLKASEGDVFCMVVLSTDKKFDSKKLNGLLKVKHLQIATREDLATVTGYPPQGVSPLGVEDLAIFMDESLLQFPTVLIGSGEVAVEVEISPQTLAEMTGATVLPLTQ